MTGGKERSSESSLEPSSPSEALLQIAILGLPSCVSQMDWTLEGSELVMVKEPVSELHHVRPSVLIYSSESCRVAMW